MGGKRGSSNTMATGGTAVVVALLAAAVLLLSTTPRGAKALEMCNMDDGQLTDCFRAIRGPSPPPPSITCCAALLVADLPCLCRYKGVVLLRSLGLDPKRAAALPGKCHMETPPECTNVP